MLRIIEFFKSRFKSFQYAFEGIFYLFRTETNAKIHLVAATLIIILSFYFGLNNVEWLFILLSIALVLICEAFNSAIEKLCDFNSLEIHPKIKIIKDIAAGAVLMAAIFALIVAIFIFIPYIEAYL